MAVFMRVAVADLRVSHEEGQQRHEQERRAAHTVEQCRSSAQHYQRDVASMCACRQTLLLRIMQAQQSKCDVGAV